MSYFKNYIFICFQSLLWSVGIMIAHLIFIELPFKSTIRPDILQASAFTAICTPLVIGVIRLIVLQTGELKGKMPKYFNLLFVLFVPFSGLFVGLWTKRKLP